MLLRNLASIITRQCHRIQYNRIQYTKAKMKKFKVFFKKYIEKSLTPQALDTRICRILLEEKQKIIF